MGCDGGSIPTRVELVKVKKKQEQHDNSESEAFKWHHCALSKERLKPPVVCCRLGNLFLKEAVLVRLLEKSLPPEFAHIKSLRDLQPVNFTPNPAWEEKTVVSFVTEGNLPSPFICPVTGLEVNGHYSFSVLRRCGCVLSERALLEVPSSECPQCGEQYSAEDIQPLNPKPELQQLLQKGVEQQQKARNKERRDEKAHNGRDKKKKGDRKRRIKHLDAEEASTKPEKPAQPQQPKKQRVNPSATETKTDVSHSSTAYRSIFTSSLKERKPATFTHYA